MDVGKGVLFSWVGQVFIRRGARGALDSKAKLPDLPHISQLLLDSDQYNWSEDCHREVCLLGMAAKYTLEEYMSSLNSPLSRRGSCAAYPITLEDSEETTLDVPGLCLLNVSTTNGAHLDKVSAGKGEDHISVEDGVEDVAFDEVALMDLDAEASAGSSVKSDGVEGSSHSNSTESQGWSGPSFGDESSSAC